ncbi:type II toxin-antitoxin system RelE/ParE family toxin [Oscillibacter hominis]|uniref:Type II toxin-antitoxin system RelE/ParE family toxin n=1 Tax=Oscillibacter hominis TaxID=2763056 RepID=A0A7G9B3D7_9FIRM|nr:type II toxin-antitoxin system RelE/ParE family toxin [Oscillibacter hominis]QNL44068.1 type II toxin-antitoxin system RelE/ParE family toxin [Oscillibacter hominis]
MREIKIYCPPGTRGPLMDFLAGLKEKLRDKLLWQIFRLSQIPLCDLKEPHFKHFVLEKYNQLYELREKNKILVRIIFTIQDGNIILLVPFVKRQPRDAMRALDLSLKMLADIREHPEYAVEFNFQEEDST